MYDTTALLYSLQNTPSKDKVKKDILACESIRDACIIAKSFLSPQGYGPLLETWVKQKWKLNNKVDTLSGDASLNGNSYEVKVSINGTDGKFNFVQLRPKHCISGYILVTYSVALDDVVYLYVPKKEMAELIYKYGEYAHGTISANGTITLESINKNSYEYAIRPNRHKPNTKPYKAWEDLEKYKVTEDELRQILHKA